MSEVIINNEGLISERESVIKLASNKNKLIWDIDLDENEI
jgi:hypothetical protein